MSKKRKDEYLRATQTFRRGGVQKKQSKKDPKKRK